MFILVSCLVYLLNIFVLNFPCRYCGRGGRRQIDLSPSVISYITDRSKAVPLIWFSLVSVSVLLLPSVYQDYIQLGLGS